MSRQICRVRGEGQACMQNFENNAQGILVSHV